MNMKKIELVNELLTEQMNHWLLFPLILTFMGIVKSYAGIGEPSLLMWVLCSLVPLTFFLFRYKVKNLLLFVLAHLGALAAVFLLSGQNWPTRLACTLCVAGYMISSFTLRLKHQSVYSEGFSFPFGVGLSAVASLLQRYQGTRGWENYYHMSLIVGIALYFLIYYIEHYIDFLNKNKSSAGFLPAAEMFHSGMGLVAVYTLAGVAILLISTQFEWLAGILRPLKDLLLRFLRFVLSRGTHPVEDIPMQEQATSQEGMGDMGLPDGGETFWLWKVLEVVLIVVFVGAALILLFRLLRKLFRWIQQYMTLHYQDRALQTGTADTFDLREKCEIEKDDRRKPLGLFSALSPRERVRRLYKKKLAAAAARMEDRDKGNLEIYTAKEWEKKLSLSGMADVYEQARYSDHEVTAADVKKMKEAWK